eukprot:NODE_1001_length_1176_cov_259.433895_g761_i0.p1 GENE.NODE_1001_length_1176_cov_259.433895_g761_i0~~NODE_1001_length_1176_cov_259.433895_g761_i0.p1  ORF type:complete len:160 (+),score=39.04 NODE_1001_length_1176_cov_259.433895_g761_i0:161-640(+)
MSSATRSKPPGGRELSNEEMAELKEAFEMFDDDASGDISLKELGRVMEQLGLTPTEAELHAIIADVDTDGSGSIEFPEFLTVMSKKMQDVDVNQEIQETFHLFDKDCNGRIDAKELRLTLAKFGEEISDTELEEMMTEADLDGDGEINFEEFARMMRTR